MKCRDAWSQLHTSNTTGAAWRPFKYNLEMYGAAGRPLKYCLTVYTVAPCNSMHL